MADLYHIFITPKTGVGRERVEEALNAAPDWMRYHERCYIIETTHSEEYWKERLKPLVDPTGHLFVCKLDPTHYQGWMTKAFWNWWQPKAKQATRR